MKLSFLIAGIGVIASLVSLGLLYLLVALVFKISDIREKKQQNDKK